MHLSQKGSNFGPERMFKGICPFFKNYCPAIFDGNREFLCKMLKKNSYLGISAIVILANFLALRGMCKGICPIFKKKS